MKLKKLAVPVSAPVKKIDMMIAVVVGMLTFVVLWLHDVIIFNDLTPSPLMLWSGVGTFITALIANVLPAKWAPWSYLVIIGVMVAIITFGHYPAN